MKVPLRLIAAVTLLAMVASARAQTDALKPAPELKRLDYFVGTWAAEGVLKPSAIFLFALRCHCTSLDGAGTAMNRESDLFHCR